MRSVLPTIPFLLLDASQVLNPKDGKLSSSIAMAADESTATDGPFVLRSTVLSAAADALCSILRSVKAGGLPWPAVSPALPPSTLQQLCWLFQHVVALKRRGAHVDQAWTASPLCGCLGNLIGAYASVLYDDRLQALSAEAAPSPTRSTSTSDAGSLTKALSP